MEGKTDYDKILDFLKDYVDDHDKKCIETDKIHVSIDHIGRLVIKPVLEMKDKSFNNLNEFFDKIVDTYAKTDKDAGLGWNPTAEGRETTIRGWKNGLQRISMIMHHENCEVPRNFWENRSNKKIDFEFFKVFMDHKNVHRKLVACYLRNVYDHTMKFKPKKPKKKETKEEKLEQAKDQYYQSLNATVFNTLQSLSTILGCIVEFAYLRRHYQKYVKLEQYKYKILKDQGTMTRRQYLNWINYRAFNEVANTANIDKYYPTEEMLGDTYHQFENDNVVGDNDNEYKFVTMFKNLRK